MPVATIRLFLNDTPASEEQLAVFGAIRVDQGIGVAAEAELDLPVGTDDGGAWQLLEDDFAQAFARIRIEVKVGDGEFGDEGIPVDVGDGGRDGFLQREGHWRDPYSRRCSTRAVHSGARTAARARGLDHGRSP